MAGAGDIMEDMEVSSSETEDHLLEVSEDLVWGYLASGWDLVAVGLWEWEWEDSMLWMADLVSSCSLLVIVEILQFVFIKALDLEDGFSGKLEGFDQII